MDKNPLEPGLERTYRARVVQEPWNYTPSEAATTNSVTNRSANRVNVEDNTSSVSVYSYTSDDASQFMREVDGRVR